MPRSTIRRRSMWPALGALITGAAALAAAPDKAPRTERGMTLVVPSQHSAMGRVYYALPGRDAQVTFTSDAPVEHIKGTSNRVVGYLVLSEGDAVESVAIKAGEFHLPVDSMDTGIPLRNEHLQEDRWLDASNHPDIVFRITGSNNARLTRQGDGFTTHDVTLLGTMEIKGEVRDIAIPATITAMPESDMTRGRAQGDLLGVRAKFEVLLTDFGVVQDEAALSSSGKISNEIGLDVALFLATTSPEEARRR